MVDIKQGDIFGRVGTSIGKGLAENVPKEIERNRFRQGVEYLGKEGANMSPFQKLGYLQSLPGTTPQFTASAADLLNKEAQGRALENINRQSNVNNENFFKNNAQSPNQNGDQNAPSITDAETLEKSLEGYIPKTRDELDQRAAQLFNANRARYNNDPTEALVAAQDEDSRNQKIAQAHQEKYQNLDKTQQNVKETLRLQSNNLKVKVPANVYSKIESEAIRATKPISKGGEGLTEEQASKDYGEKLDKISRQYENVKSIGNWGITFKSPKKTLDTINALEKDFRERDDTQNLGDEFINKQKLSPMFAFSLAEPVRNNKSLSRDMKKLPKLEREFFLNKPKNINSFADFSVQQTEDIAPKFAEYLKKGGASPLAVAYELEKNGYDADTFLNYVVENQKALNLTANQIDQIEKPRNAVGTINDVWLSSFTGL
jgi:hypothetical protein